METTENPFKIRTYGFCELAMLYFPHISKKSASQKFGGWIRYSSELQRKLGEAEYVKSTRSLTPRQVKIIVTHLGEP